MYVQCKSRNDDRQERFSRFEFSSAIPYIYGMSGHSHWAGIKHKKGIADQKRGKIFSKLLIAITVAAKGEPNPDFNPRLRDAVLKAKENSVPADNINRAIKRASESAEALDELMMEAYGPGGTAILIEAATDNRNRTVAEVKQILGELDGKWAEPGSVRWAFEALPAAQGGWQAKFPQSVSLEDTQKLQTLIKALEEHDDVQHVYTNVSSASNSLN